MEVSAVDYHDRADQVEEREGERHGLGRSGRERDMFLLLSWAVVFGIDKLSCY